MKINLLDSSIYNLISAGEVVENPASVVKELVENSIDAGALNVSVYIEEGGIRSIEVIDDGAGIQKDELSKTILPHATSKIKEAEDLYTISTLGFRGEALASISAVAEVEIRSRYFEDENGAYLLAKNGNVEIGDCAVNQGTSIKVSNLFYNTPARFKFLSSKTTEESYVTKLIFKLILANPTVAIRYYTDGKLVYSSPGSDLKGAIDAVFMPKIAESFIELDDEAEGSTIRVQGFISPQEVFKNNRNLQIIILNGRVITDQTLSATIQNAYGTRLMARCFPIYVLNVVMPFDEVDVNVHPNKKEVRFQNARKVYGHIYRRISANLERYELNKRTKLVAEFSGFSDENVENVNNTEPRGDVKINRGSEKVIETCLTNTSQSIANDNIKAFDINDALKLVRGVDVMPMRFESAPITNILLEEIDPFKPECVDPININNTANVDSIDNTVIQQAEMSLNDTIIKNSVKNYTVVGQFFNTYLAIECNDKIIFIDQHAMHERILFDALVEEWSSKSTSIQPLMIPYIFEGTVDEVNAILNSADILASAGFEIEPFGGNAVRVSSIPLLIANKLDIGKMLTEIATEILSGKQTKLTDVGKDKLASMACKAAIKGGKELSNEQIELVMDFFNEGHLPLQCPHGRPTAIIYTQKEFEKLFRRRV